MYSSTECHLNQVQHFQTFNHVVFRHSSCNFTASQTTSINQNIFWFRLVFSVVSVSVIKVFFAVMFIKKSNPNQANSICNNGYQ